MLHDVVSESPTGYRILDHPSHATLVTYMWHALGNAHANTNPTHPRLYIQHKLTTYAQSATGRRRLDGTTKRSTSSHIVGEEKSSHAIAHNPRAAPPTRSLPSLYQKPGSRCFASTLRQGAFSGRVPRARPEDLLRPRAIHSGKSRLASHL